VRPSFSLIVISDGEPDLVRRLERLGPALSPQVALLLRDKQASQAELIGQGHALRALTRAHGATLLVSEHLELARACQADGVHLPEVAVSIAQARATLGDDRWIGVSRHDFPGVSAAAQAGADYATLSPVFASPGKGAALGVEAFAQSARATRLPLFALGGVGVAQVLALLDAGAAGVAVIREVLAAANPPLALAALQRALTHARSG
jgi:thiamine-phosphate pyrophosphorylase